MKKTNEDGTNENYFELDDIRTWIEQENSIQIKAVTGHGDPVELSADEARDLGMVLTNLRVGSSPA